MPLYLMHQRNMGAGVLSPEDTQRYLGLYAAFFAGILAATLVPSLRRVFR